MINFSLIHQIFIYIISIISLWLAAWVYLVNRSSKANQFFSIFTIFILLWINFSFLTNLPTQTDRALFWIRLNFGAVVLFFISVYFFSIYFPQEKERKLILDRIVLIIGVVLFLASVFTGFIIKDVEFKTWGVEPILGDRSIVFFGIVVTLTFLIFLNLFKKYFNLSKEKRVKVQYFLIGASLFALFNLIFNVIFPVVRKTYEYHYLGGYSAIFFLVFTAFAIVKRELFGMKVVLTTLLVGLIAILLLLDALIFTQDLFFQVLKGAIFFIFLFFGYYLIRSVQMEIKRREELEELTFRLEKVNVELATAYKKLERLDKAKTEFLSIASHQLRTPLTAVKGYISMMIEKIYGKLPQKMEKPLKNIYDSNERLIKLVNGLLNISRIEAGKLEMDIKELSVEKMINDIIKELDRVVKEKNIYLKLEETKESLPLISVDEEKIRQAITNIIDNAIKYTGKGGVTIKIQVIDQKIQIIITDTGEGMSQDEISNLFVSFTRGKAGNKLWTEGAGLGLYIAKKFVEIHNGKVWAESQGKSHGSIFYIELPIKSTLNI